jgi:hypothetical protein
MQRLQGSGRPNSTSGAQQRAALRSGCLPHGG